MAIRIGFTRRSARDIGARLLSGLVGDLARLVKPAAEPEARRAGIQPWPHIVRADPADDEHRHVPWE